MIFIERTPDRYGHTEQFLEKVEVYNDNFDVKISRKEACGRIVDIIKK